MCTICIGMRVGQVYNLYRKLSGTRREIDFEILHGHPDEVVVIDPAAVTLSRRESQRLR